MQGAENPRFPLFPPQQIFPGISAMDNQKKKSTDFPKEIFYQGRKADSGKEPPSVHHGLTLCFKDRQVRNNDLFSREPRLYKSVSVRPLVGPSVCR